MQYLETLSRDNQSIKQQDIERLIGVLEPSLCAPTAFYVLAERAGYIIATFSSMPTS